MSRYVFDIETNGLLPELTTIHSLVLKDIDTGAVTSCARELVGDTGNSIAWGLTLLAEAELIVGHNIIAFDIPGIQKVYPDWKPKGRVRDTLVRSRLLKPDIRDGDFKLAKQGKLPKKMIGRHSLESWGYRLGKWKGDYAQEKEAEAKKLGIKDKALITQFVWGSWNPEMQAYCEQDVEVTLDLWNWTERTFANGWSEECDELEHEVAWVIARQERYGVAFDEEAAAEFYATLVGHRTRLETELQKTFKPITVTTTFVPKVNSKKLGYTKGVPFDKHKVVPFNPGSRQQVAERLRSLGWEPTEFGKDGIPTVDDETLQDLPWPEAKLIAEYYMVDKRLGQLANGKQAWMKHVQRDGRIHNEVIPNGAVTGRMTHRVVANVPGLVDKKTGKPQPYGEECRKLFTATLKKGKVFAGCDADSLEGRIMAHYMARYDGGDYTNTLLKGNKAEGTDSHSRTAKAWAEWNCHRETAKTGFYALIYGCLDPKLASILGVKGTRAKMAAAGKKARSKLMQQFTGLGKLVEAVVRVWKERGFIKGLDGRKLRVRAENAILNTLFQSAGAIVMKRALIILDTSLSGVLPSVIGTQGVSAATRLVPGDDYEFAINYHDEWQIDTKEELAKKVCDEATSAIEAAGNFYSFRCPLKGNAEIGRNWAETH